MNIALYLSLAIVLVWIIVLYRRHHREFNDFEESVRRNLSGIFEKKWGVMGYAFAIGAYTKLNLYKLDWYAFENFVKERIKKDPNGRRWAEILRSGEKIPAHWLANFAADYVEEYRATVRLRAKINSR